MTSRGKRIAALVAVLAVMALPKKVPCEVPGRDCSVHDDRGRTCEMTDLEPFGVYLIEYLAGRDVSVAYRTWLECP